MCNFAEVMESNSDTNSKPTRRYLWGNCLGMLAVALFLLIGTMIFLRFYTHHGEEVDVPEVCGQQADVAIRKLEAAGLRAEVRDTGYVAGKPADAILEQSIEAGTHVKAQRMVYLTINSATPRLILFPDIADNCSAREAEFKLKNLGFKLTPPEYITGDEDWVYAVKAGGRTLSAGMKVSVLQPITLVLGDGKTQDEFNGNDTLDYLYFHKERELPDSL